MVSRTLRSLALSAMAIMILTSAAVAEGSATFEAAQKLAADQGKLLLVDFYADWCGPCKRFTADAASNALLKEGLEQVVLFTIDAEKGAGIDLAKRYSVSSFPNYLLADAEGEPIARWVGYGVPEGFLETLNENLVDPTTLTQKRARFEASPNAADAASLGSAEYAMKGYLAALEWYEKAASIEGGFEGEIFSAMLRASKDGHFTREQLVNAADLAMEKGNMEAKQEVYYAQGYMAKVTDDESLAYRYVEDAWAMVKDDPSPELAKMRAAVEIDYAMFIEKDRTRAADLKFASMPEGWQQDSGQLNGYAWWCFEHQVDLERAEGLARKGVELTLVAKEKAMILDTAAELCNSLGECHEAVALMEQAIEYDPENEYYQTQLTRFRELAVNQG